MRSNNNNKLKAYVRFDGTGRIVPGSLVVQSIKPKDGNWQETDAKECCNPTTTTTTTAAPTTTTTTTTGIVLYETLISTTSVEYPAGDACGLELVDTVWTEGEFVATKVYTDALGTTPFDGLNEGWRMQRVGETSSATYPIANNGDVFGPELACP